MSTPAWFEKPTPLQAAEMQYVRAVPPLLTDTREQHVGHTEVSAQILPAIGTAVPERLRVTAAGETIGAGAGTVQVTTIGSEHIVEFVSPEGDLSELDGDEKIAALSGITAVVLRDRSARNRASAA
jgi:hypothetical protein